MNEAKADEVRTLVREHYGQIGAAGSVGCCAPAPQAASGCCAPAVTEGTAAQLLGYSPADTAAVGDGAELGLGCGNPTAIAALRPGETVLDLGSGGGFDCFLAARQVGPTGTVIGVDMTPEMIARARANARKLEATNVDFRLGEIEHLPVADGTVDAILSNCVINLSPEKAAVFAEAFRVLKPGGRLAISDIVATAPIPAELQGVGEALCACIAGAAPLDDVRAMLAAAGFVDVAVEIAPNSAAIVGGWLPGADRYIASAKIQAIKPGGAPRAQASCCDPGCCA